jgi:hypothetical protein
MFPGLNYPPNLSLIHNGCNLLINNRAEELSSNFVTNEPPMKQPYYLAQKVLAKIYDLGHNSSTNL